MYSLFADTETRFPQADDNLLPPSSPAETDALNRQTPRADHQCSKDSGVDLREAACDDDVRGQCVGKRQCNDDNDDGECCPTAAKKMSRLHVLAMAASIVENAASEGDDGPLFRPWMVDESKPKPMPVRRGNGAAKRRRNEVQPSIGFAAPQPGTDYLYAEPAATVVAETNAKRTKSNRRNNERAQNKIRRNRYLTPEARRLSANARERNRVQTLIDALARLRSVIPSYSCDQRLSQLDTLQVANAYILGMSRMLGLDYSADQTAPSVAECFNRIIEILPPHYNDDKDLGAEDNGN